MNIIAQLLIISGMILIIVMAFKALWQHDLKKAILFDAAAQAGYIIIGVASSNKLAFIGGIFHLVNSAVYVSLMLLAAAAVKQQAKTLDMDSLGGLARRMPVTYVSFFIAAMALAGMPPLNGFVSKWLIYQGLLQSAVIERMPLLLAALIVTILGSALTLASSIKLLHATFLTTPSKQTLNAGETGFAMRAALVTLAAICVLFGIFAFGLPLPVIISSLKYPYGVALFGFWQPVLAALLMFTAMAAGWLFYIIFLKKNTVRRDTAFTGCETPDKETYPTGTGFYQTLKDLRILK
ncbi:MAG: hypothetical protein A2219_05040 [Elusimicrobia bacterium RIFOXYA2_FULL_50_26]|nr:MAG: hypothetical protein A2219_05040 [Elusimicrobia bacterium RIFOXYA2_FULL_50_26]OGS22867.1 MAG: hypothetical protein A2314_02350 [Elusimicrobia bacterium RIFOXYB2_FULL_50_12]